MARLSRHVARKRATYRAQASSPASGLLHLLSALDISENPRKKRAVQQTPDKADEGHEILTSFVRHRNVLLAQGAFSELYVDYYLHLAEHGLRHADAHDALFKDALAAFTLHCASRPPKETIAWTLHFQEPFVNLFLGGDTDDSIVTGRVFAEDVKEMESNRLYADVARPGDHTHSAQLASSSIRVFRSHASVLLQGWTHNVVNKMNTTLLLVAYAFPPENVSGAARTSRTALRSAAAERASRRGRCAAPRA